MPVGFARSLLVSNTGTSVGVDKGYWNQTDSIASQSYKGLKFTKSSSYSATSNLDISFWFKGTASDLDPAFDAANVFLNEGGQEDIFVVDMHKNYGITAIQFRFEYGGESISSHQNTNNNFANSFLNNAWHHCYIQWRGRANDNTKSRIYLDGVDTTYSKTAGTMPSDTPVSTVSRIFNNGNKDKRSLLNKADFYQIFGNTSNNLSTQTKWYNSGYVDLGADGTASGAPTPQIYLYVSNGTVVQGGSLSGTLEEEGTGTLNKNNTGGPGA